MKVYTAQIEGLLAKQIVVEIDIDPKFKGFSIVGLADKAIEEAKERVSSALYNSGFESPTRLNQKVIISLVPSDIRKSGALFDLPIAVSFLAKTKIVPEEELDNSLFVGELSLSGELLPVKGVLPIVNSLREKFDRVFVPYKNAKEAGLVSGIDVIPVRSLKELVLYLNGRLKIKPYKSKLVLKDKEPELTLDDIVGQDLAKRALKIAIAGGHNIVFYGPPGTGKSMLAKASASLLPNLTLEEAIEVSSIYSVAGKLDKIVVKPPFRNPHHSSSHIAIVGGGKDAVPGEISLAHKGILFLDEMPEFESRVLNALRQPLEDKKVTISRVSAYAEYPADFILIGAMNPCPCGYLGTDKCVCTISSITRYQKKISGPIKDRIDLWVPVEKVEYKKILSNTKAENNYLKDRKEVEQARLVQLKRQKSLNASLSARETKNIKLTPDAKSTLEKLSEVMNLSYRAIAKVIKVARTIADLEKREFVEKTDILEAANFKEPQFDY